MESRIPGSVILLKILHARPRFHRRKASRGEEVVCVRHCETVEDDRFAVESRISLREIFGVGVLYALLVTFQFLLSRAANPSPPNPPLPETGRGGAKSKFPYVKRSAGSKVVDLVKDPALSTTFPSANAIEGEEVVCVRLCLTVEDDR